MLHSRAGYLSAQACKTIALCAAVVQYTNYITVRILLYMLLAGILGDVQGDRADDDM